MTLCPPENRETFLMLCVAPSVWLTLAQSLFVFFLLSTLLSTFDHFFSPSTWPQRFCLFFLPSAPLYCSSLKGVMKKIIVQSLADNSLVVTQIALMLSLGLAQSVHSVFHPLNLQPRPLYLPLSHWTHVFSLVRSLAWSSLYPLPVSPSISLSPLTSFFSLHLQVLFFSLSPDAR